MLQRFFFCLNGRFTSGGCVTTHIADIVMVFSFVFIECTLFVGEKKRRQLCICKQSYAFLSMLLLLLLLFIFFCSIDIDGYKLFFS